jgi:hypothetical protein
VQLFSGRNTHLIYFIVRRVQIPGKRGRQKLIRGKNMLDCLLWKWRARRVIVADEERIQNKIIRRRDASRKSNKTNSIKVEILQSFFLPVFLANIFDNSIGF